MRLSPCEIDHLLIYQAGSLAQRRLARGLRLNYTETIALISFQLLEFVRDGKSVAETTALGSQILGKRQVMIGVDKMIDNIQVEGTFLDGTKLVSVNQPIVREHGNMALAFYGSFLPIPALSLFEEKEDEEEKSVVNPGEIVFTTTEDILINTGREVKELIMTNKSDRPIQIGSHYHLIEANKYMEFDRILAYGYRLNLPSGTAMRFEPGDTKVVTIVKIEGDMVIHGGNGVATGHVNQERIGEIVKKAEVQGFLHKPQESVTTVVSKSKSIPRHMYAEMYGPTLHDRIRLGDTSLIIEIEKDYTIYGEECKFGGGKTIRDGMAQKSGIHAKDALDTVITNAVIVDCTGIYKADIGIKDAYICGIGKAGNPDIMNGVEKNMVIGVNTEVIAGEGCILTAGGFDSHVHFICPQLAYEAIASGLTSLLGGGTGPATGTCATTCTPSPFFMKKMLQSTDTLPVNIGLTGKGNTSSIEGLQEVIDAGAVGLKLHEDWGSTPAAIDTCLSFADLNDIQVTIHTDTLNESCCVETTIEAINGRTIHAYHSEGAGGGHAPDIIKVCGCPNIIPSSTNPTRPFTKNTIDEHIDMLMVCHHLNKNIPEDIAFAESRIRGETISAEGILHDLGAISIISSDSQAMGRIGEVIARTWQTAHHMKLQRGFLPEDQANQNDNYRVKRYISKYTINPAIAHGVDKIIGSIEIGKYADLCLWKPAFFGIKPELVLKGGVITYAQMGDSNASIPTPQPILMRPMFGSFNISHHSLVFISKSSKETIQTYDLHKQPYIVRDCRKVKKQHMIYNNYLPKIDVNPETYVVTIDGIPLHSEPASKLPLAQRYRLF